MNAIQERPASLGNFRTGRTHQIDMLVIHVMEGFYGPTAAWFADSEAHDSAHFGIGVDGSIARYVRESDTAWHAGNRDINARSIGIELEGHSADVDAFTVKMMSALVELSRMLCLEFGIPLDRQHLIGHNEVPDPRCPGQFGGAGHHSDPGPYFDWSRFMSALQSPSIGAV